MGGHGSGRPPNAKSLVDRQLGRNTGQEIIPAGDGFIIPNLSGDHSAGTTGTPVADRDIANKKYVDGFIKLTGTNIADETNADTSYVALVLFNTDATPPTASNFPKGTIYIQYTA